MPLYEYRCKECAHLEEFLQKLSDPAPVTCPACKREHTLEKQVSLGSFQLKGGGWYKDLYSSTKADSKADAKSDAPAAKSESKEAAPKTAAKTEAAPAKAKSETKSKSPSSPKAA